MPERSLEPDDVRRAVACTLTAAQERYLLRWHLGQGGGSPKVAHALFAAGMLGATDRGNVVITATGRAYLDAYHLEILL